MPDQTRNTLHQRVSTHEWSEKTSLDSKDTQAYLEGCDITPEIMNRLGTILQGDLAIPSSHWYSQLLSTKYVKGKITKKQLNIKQSMIRMIDQDKTYDWRRPHMIPCKPATGP